MSPHRTPAEATPAPRDETMNIDPPPWQQPQPPVPDVPFSSRIGKAHNGRPISFDGVPYCPTCGSPKTRGLHEIGERGLPVYACERETCGPFEFDDREGGIRPDPFGEFIDDRCAVCEHDHLSHANGAGTCQECPAAKRCRRFVARTRAA